MFFFFNDTATTEIYTLSLHDALPIYLRDVLARAGGGQRDRERVPGAPPGVRPRASRRGARRAAHGRGRLPDPTTAPRRGRRVRGAAGPDPELRFRRHLRPLGALRQPGLGGIGSRRM